MPRRSYGYFAEEIDFGYSHFIAMTSVRPGELNAAGGNRKSAGCGERDGMMKRTRFRILRRDDIDAYSRRQFIIECARAADKLPAAPDDGRNITYTRSLTR